MPAAFNKFQQFPQDLGRAVLNLNTDQLWDILTNTVPNTADIKYNSSAGPPAQVQATSNAPEIGAGNGYSAGGVQATVTSYAQSGGTGTLACTLTSVITASVGTIGPFRYVVMYDKTSGTASTRSVIGWWDYGSSITLNPGETFTIDHTGGILTIA